MTSGTCAGEATGAPAGQTRREFLAISAAAVLAGVSASARLSDVPLYVGTYTDDGRTDGVYLLRLIGDTGELRYLGGFDAGPNPSFLALHPNGRVLYAVNEVEQLAGRRGGGVTALRIDAATSALAKLGTQPSEGGAPCYVSVDRSGAAVLVANYATGSVALLPLATDGALRRASHVDQHRGTGPNRERQEGPHAHCILPDPSNRFALSADLGADRLVVYELDVERGSMRHVEAADVAMQAGAGPRHVAFHPRMPLVFVANELDSTVSTLRFDRERGTLTLASSVSTLPAGWRGANFPADIHVARGGHTLYVSNRGHNSIAVFSIARGDGALSLEQVISTEGDWPRNFALDPSERWLLVANQRSGNIVVFARDAVTGRLARTAQRISLASPVCLRFAADRFQGNRTGDRGWPVHA